MKWKRPEIVEKTALLKEISAIDPHYRFTPLETAVDALDLPFFAASKLLRVAKPGKPLWYVKTQSEIVALDGSVANLNYLEVKAPLSERSPAYEKFRQAFGNKVLPDDFSLT